METYEQNARIEMRMWQQDMLARPSMMSSITNGIQQRVNHLIPEKVHQIVTEAIKNMIKAVLLGSEFTTAGLLTAASLEERERLVGEKIIFYRNAGVVSGAGTGAGGFLLGLADFPILLSLKMKFLFDTATLYGFNISDYRERLFTLYIFQLAFSSPERRAIVYRLVSDWDHHVSELPKDLNLFDWRTLQQQYRDYIDLAKTAMNAYRMRLLR